MEENIMSTKTIVSLLRAKAEKDLSFMNSITLIVPDDGTEEQVQHGLMIALKNLPPLLGTLLEFLDDETSVNADKAKAISRSLRDDAYTLGPVLSNIVLEQANVDTRTLHKMVTTIYNELRNDSKLEHMLRIIETF